MKCKICNKEFRRVCGHVSQAHGISAREYKERFGFDVGRGLLEDDDRQHMRELALKNGMDKQLKKVGEKTRFKKSQPGLGKYKRSEQTLKRLKHNTFKVTPVKNGVEISCNVCGKLKYVIKSRVTSAKFCSISCSNKSRANNIQKTKLERR